MEKGITKLITDIGSSNCPDCESLYSSILVPPTFFKNMNNVFLQQIWNKAEQELRKVDQIIFCGYSFPDADIHIKYLIKRIQTNGNKAIIFTIINHFNGKEDRICEEEANRYKRFLGGNVNYTKISFEEFALDPLQFIT